MALFRSMMSGYYVRLLRPAGSATATQLGLFIPAVLLGGLGLSHHYAARELDDFIREAEQPAFGFGWGFGLGLLSGIWIGASFADWFGGLRYLGQLLVGIFRGSSKKADAEIAEPNPTRQNF